MTIQPSEILASQFCFCNDARVAERHLLLMEDIYPSYTIRSKVLISRTWTHGGANRKRPTAKIADSKVESKKASGSFTTTTNTTTTSAKRLHPSANLDNRILRSVAAFSATKMATASLMAGRQSGSGRRNPEGTVTKKANPSKANPSIRKDTGPGEMSASTE
ncbi:hypothetical protein LguiA_009445 [Lonicera macranthoides]